MATFTKRINELSGETGLSVRIYADGSPTIANGAGGDALTETDGSDGEFKATIAETLTGGHDYYVYKSGNPIFEGRLNSDGSTLVVDAPTISPSDVGKRTGYLVCYDEEGNVEADVVVTVTCYFAPDTGLALDSEPRTETSGVDGVVAFTNMIVGAKYRIKRGDQPETKVEVLAGSGSFALESIVGKE